jgi:hypothetical protein
MKCKNKGQIPHNHTLDKYLKPKSRVEEKETVKKRVSCIKVPPSSGLLLSTPPTNVVLVFIILRRGTQSILNLENTSRK